MPEAKLQEACVEWLRKKNFLFVASAVTQYKNGARTAASLKRRGVEAGVPDLLILESSPYICGRMPSGILAVELKIGTNTLSVKQQAWLDRAASRGHTTAVVRSLESFKSVVMEHIHPGAGTAAQPYLL